MKEHLFIAAGEIELSCGIRFEKQYQLNIVKTRAVVDKNSMTPNVRLYLQIKPMYVQKVRRLIDSITLLPT